MCKAEFEAELSRLEALAEKYAAMVYDAPDPTTATGHYSNMKDFFSDAIGLARRAGRSDHVERLEQRLSELKQQYRDQFTGFDHPLTRNRIGPSSKWREAQKAENSGDYTFAERTYEEVLNLDDPHSELGDIKASAGLQLALLRLKLNRPHEAIEPFQCVMNISDAPSALKNAAREAVKELHGDMFHELDVVQVIKLLKSDRPYSGTEGVCRPPRLGDIGTIVFVSNPEASGIFFSVECMDKNGATLWLADFSFDELRSFDIK
jgi:tetratricopeptide (TPR) repeat protein